ncbi:MAG: PmoA family protein [Acidobacteria bacterium]|nr:PmoA family protein [Acidobacteriota bacterium]
MRTGYVAILSCAFAIVLPAAAAGAKVKFHKTPGKIEISMDGKPFTRFIYGAEWSTPFLHPLRTSTGVVVTRGYPVEKIAGESEDHIWHHGLWYSHGDINGVDFWRDLGPAKTGRMVVTGSPKSTGNRISADVLLVTPAKETIGTVTEQFTFSRAGANHVIDVNVTIRAGRGRPLKMGDTEEGALGIRFADEFRVDRGATLTNSGGVIGRGIWGKRAKWVDYSTTIQGQKAGVLILDDPANPKYPTWWHARHYGFAAVNPFGVHDFEHDRSKDGSVTIPSGRTLAFHYRLVIHPGSLDSVNIEEFQK